MSWICHASRASLLVLFFLLSGCLSLQGNPQSTPTYHSAVSEVRLLFIATGQHEHAVSNLAAGDFVVVDDNIVVRTFSSFGLSRVTAVRVAVLVDCSESVGARSRRQFLLVPQLVGRATWIADENLSVSWFGGTSSTMLCAGDCRRVPLPGLLSAVPATGSTPLFDSLTHALHGLSQPAGTQSVLLLFSDGEDTISMESLEDAVRAALEGDIQIDAVDLNQDSNSRGSITLQRLAEDTGGRYFSADADAASIDDALLENLHAAYTLTYKPPITGRNQHSVRIFPAHDLNLSFRCRRTYYRNSTN